MKGGKTRLLNRGDGCRMLGGATSGDDCAPFCPLPHGLADSSKQSVVRETEKEGSTEEMASQRPRVVEFQKGRNGNTITQSGDI